MHTVVVWNQKGGVGKTTLTMHTAVEAVRQGWRNTFMVDMDAQGSLADMFNARKDKAPAMFEPTTVAQLPGRLEAARAAGVDLVMIDTPPSQHAEMRDVLVHADLVVMPTRPSPVDLRAMVPSIRVVQELGLAQRAVFVINAANSRAKLTTQSMRWLMQWEGFTLAPVNIGDRNDFKASATDGRTVQELDPAAPSSKEVGALFEYLRARLDRRAVQAAA